MSPEAPRLTDAQTVEVLELIGGADSVELKLSIAADRQRATIEALGLDPLEAQIRQVYFFDTPGLALNQRGLVVRARRIQDKGDDSVVKLRPVDPAQLPAKLRSIGEFGVEVDAMPGGYVCSGSMKRERGPYDVKGAVAGDKPLHKLFSKAQRELYEEHAPDGLAIDELTPLGPITLLKLKFDDGSGRKMVAELWFYPDGSRILELSTKCLPAETFQVVAELRAGLSRAGVDISGEQETKTRKALDFFSAQLTV